MYGQVVRCLFLAKPLVLFSSTGGTPLKRFKSNSLQTINKYEVKRWHVAVEGGEGHLTF